MKNNKKLVISTIIGIFSLVLLIFGATYAYFAVTGVDNTYNTSITANVAQAGGSFEATTASLNFDVSLENMSVSNAGSVAGMTDTSYIIVNATAPEGTIMTCTYDIDFAWKDGDRYTDYSNRNEIEEYLKTKAGDQSMDDDSFPEFWLVAVGEADYNYFNGLDGTLDNLTKITKDGSSIEHVIEEASITVYGGRTNARRWLILSGINNLDVNQNSIAGKSYSFDLKVTDVNCELESVGNTTYTPQMGDLFELDGDPFYYLWEENNIATLIAAKPLYVNLNDEIVIQSNESHPATKIGISDNDSCDIIENHEEINHDQIDWNTGSNNLTNILAMYRNDAYLLDLYEVAKKLDEIDLATFISIYPHNGWGNVGSCGEDDGGEFIGEGVYYDATGELAEIDSITGKHYIYPVIKVSSSDLN